MLQYIGLQLYLTVVISSSEIHTFGDASSSHQHHTSTRLTNRRNDETVDSPSSNLQVCCWVSHWDQMWTVVPLSILPWLRSMFNVDPGTKILMICNWQENRLREGLSTWMRYCPSHRERRSSQILDRRLGDGCRPEVHCYWDRGSDHFLDSWKSIGCPAFRVSTKE